MSLPIFQTEDQNLSLLQTRWAAQLNPILASLLSQGQLLRNVDLINGDTEVNHKLGRKLIGWVLTRVRGAAQIYDNQDTNSMSQLTLSLTSDADVTVDLWVF